VDPQNFRTSFTDTASGVRRNACAVCTTALSALGMCGQAPRRYPILVYGPLDESRELPAVVLYLRLDSGYARQSFRDL
jgi:hypothetical protein